MADTVSDIDTMAPVTQERIEAELDRMGLKHFRGDDGMTRTAFPGLVCFFAVEPAGFQATARWLGTATEVNDVATMRLKANELNGKMPLLRTKYFTREGGTAIVLLEGNFFADGGVTDGQLAAMLEFYFSAIHHVAGELREALPGLEESLETPANPEGEA